jgi:predicted lipoprotein with Yx(FWY)xxD motif
MNISTKLLTLGFASLLLLAACGSDNKSNSSSSKTTTSTSGSTSTTSGATTTTGGAAAAGTTVAVASNSLGNILVDSKGMTLYVWDNDTTAGKSGCTGACAQAWPPLTVTGTPTYGTGLNASMFSTITRDDGTMQLAVNGHPLYRWAADTKAGDTTGQGVANFHVAGSDGNRISS